MRAHTIMTKALRRLVLLVGAVGALMLGTAAPAPTSTGAKEGTLSTGPGGPTATLTGNGVTTPTPPVLPLQVFLSYYGRNDVLLEKKLKFTATTNNDSTLVATGSKIKNTTKQLAAGEETVIKVKLKHPKRLNQKACQYRLGGAAGRPARGCPTAKIKVKATDEFGQAATDELKIWYYKNPSL
jgi:hypothetical protein